MIIIDSDSRLKEKESDIEPVYKKLPMMNMDGIDLMEHRNNSIFYKNRKLIDLEEISHCQKGIEIGDNIKYKWYYFYISSTQIESENDYLYYKDNNFLDNKTLYFDDNPIQMPIYILRLLYN